MYTTGKKAQEKFGYNPRTLSRWADEGKIKSIKSPGGHRRFLISSIENVVETVDDREVILYARVSTSTQKDDLQNQIKFLASNYPNTKCVNDIASGLNFKRKNFTKLMEQVGRGEVKKIVIGHKDRLCRFGFEFVEWYCNQNKCQIEVLDNAKLSPHEELMKDFMAIMHCFSSKLYFLRRYQKDITEELKLDKIDKLV